MVNASPELLQRIFNTANLISIGRSDLIPPESTSTILDLNTFNTLATTKPWAEPRDLSGMSVSRLRMISPGPIEKEIGRQKYIGSPVNDRILILCVDFSDRPFQIPISTITDRFFSILNSKTFRNYYVENSYGAFIPDGEVHGWYRAPNPSTFYTNNNNGFGAYPNNVQKLYEDVLNIASTDPNINWNFIDANNDGVIDHVFIVHSGAEAASTGNLNDFWAAAWTIAPKRVANKNFSPFAMSAEYISNPTGTQVSGVDIHEFGHLLGLPDLYDTTQASNGVGIWSVMGSGSWADSGKTPVHFDAWSKFTLGWSSSTDIITNPSGLVSIAAIETSPIQVHFSTQDPNQIFVIENRQQISFDTFIPGPGLLIWRINKLIPDNSNRLCYYVGLVEADGRDDLVNRINIGSNGDPFPGFFNIRSIGPSTTPSSLKLCNGVPINILINQISDSAPVMTFNSTIIIPVGSISFISQPSGAEIFLDGIDKLVKTPNTITDIPTGSHSYILKLPGYIDKPGTVDVLQNQTVTVPVNLVLIPVQAGFGNTAGLLLAAGLLIGFLYSLSKSRGIK